MVKRERDIRKENRQAYRWNYDCISAAIHLILFLNDFEKVLLELYGSIKTNWPEDNPATKLFNVYKK
jgi:hypothetical protein